ncbi:hypothetical protein [Roseovarius sp. D22-M7]|uniref:hypothetical protein n=1 Tax=Roseovarius sp. D22-M7 TaxID=3127116 RepID=UPI00300F8FF6
MSYDVVIAPGREAHISKVLEGLKPDESQGVDEALADLETVGHASDEAAGNWHYDGTSHEIGVVPAPNAPHVTIITSSQTGSREIQVHDILTAGTDHARKAAPGISSKSLDLGPNRHWEAIP